MLRTTTGLALTLTLMTDVALATPLPPPRELVSSEGAPLAPAEASFWALPLDEDNTIGAAAG